MAQPRVASLIASSTEIVCALGLGDLLVARSHECDHPAWVKDLPQVTAARVDPGASSAEIDRQVKRQLETSLSVYSVDAAALQALRPDVILTQMQCEVCAVSQRDVDLALGDWPGPRPEVVALSPANLQDVLDDLERVAAALGAPGRGRALAATLRARLDAVAARVAGRPRPRVALLEWLDPLMTAGNWMPELCALAGGDDPFGRPGEHAPYATWEQLVAADPEVIVALPCGFDLDRTQAELTALTSRPGWAGLRAVRAGRVAVCDGNAFFNRPGPRLVESAEALAELFHPDVARFGLEGVAWRRAV
ncbi:MAG: cobalamin-binding protein [Planctomycetes bacterium]|nr:cobalamin-binding protein [Planctomycetota bacterium]